ncbi:DegT/DnrJ/EryC1/StrS family aminotransferase [Fibrobacter sp.]|uniref:DegT/DnrJ/EryC1/StrS family aminotransferase n=1 Tax=Fibrobacter sp. TaxID=35828 RepID=UPI003453170D
MIREKGTNRAQFFRGQVAKYNWVDFGSSWLPSDLNAAYLWGQLQFADKINENRLETWNAYYEAFKALEENGLVELPVVPKECKHNAHMFYMKLKDLETRQDFIRYMKENDILCVFHYVPLHSAPAGLKFGRFKGKDLYTTSESDRLVRLPLYYGIAREDLDKVIHRTLDFFKR